jgi:hypothetical protein
MSESSEEAPEKGWFDKNSPPPVGTRVQWTEFVGGWHSTHWGVVQRLTKATVVLACPPTKTIQEEGDGASHYWVKEPLWDAKAGYEARARYVGGSCWCVNHCRLEPYDGKPGDQQAYY